MNRKDYEAAHDKLEGDKELGSSAQEIDPEDLGDQSRGKAPEVREEFNRVEANEGPNPPNLNEPDLDEK